MFSAFFRWISSFVWSPTSTNLIDSNDPISDSQTVDNDPHNFACEPIVDKNSIIYLYFLLMNSEMNQKLSLKDSVQTDSESELHGFHEIKSEDH